MTTGGPDTSDVYEEEVQDGKYKFKGEWRPLEVRTERIGVKDGERSEVDPTSKVESTHHGPIVAHKDGKAYSDGDPVRRTSSACSKPAGRSPPRTTSPRRKRRSPACSSWRRTS